VADYSVPDPGRTIAQHRASWRLGEASPRGFAQHALGEVGCVSLEVYTMSDIEQKREAVRKLEAAVLRKSNQKLSA